MVTAGHKLLPGHGTCHFLSLFLPSEPVGETAPAVRPRLARLAPVAIAAVLSHLLLLLRLQGHVGAVAAAHHAAHVVLVVLKGFIRWRLHQLNPKDGANFTQAKCVTTTWADCPGLQTLNW